MAFKKVYIIEINVGDFFTVCCNYSTCIYTAVYKMIMEDKFMGNINRPKLDTEDIELMRKIGKHNFVDMIYIYKFYKTDCKKRTVNERITQLAKYRYLSIIETFIPPEYTVKK